MKPPLPVSEECESCPCGRASRAVESACPFVTLEIERGAHLFHEGESADRVWFVRRGTVVLSRVRGAAPAGRARAVRGHGDFVGLEALVHASYLDNARATAKVAACMAKLPDVDAWLGARGTPARTALEQVLRCEAHEPLAAASPDGTALARVARWILNELGENAGRELPRRDVAGLLGMVPETFSRALAELTRRAAIETTRFHLRITDADALRRAAGQG